MGEAGGYVITVMRQTLHSAYLCNVGYNELVTQNRQLLLLCFCSTFNNMPLPFCVSFCRVQSTRVSAAPISSWHDAKIVPTDIEYVPAEDPPRMEIY
jgi:hypothetical protein